MGGIHEKKSPYLPFLYVRSWWNVARLCTLPGNCDGPYDVHLKTKQEQGRMGDIL